MRRYPRSLSRQEVRGIDIEAAERLGLPTIVLMENAGRGAAAWFAELAAGLSPEVAARPFSATAGREPLTPLTPLPRVLIFCGPGNNGGDGGVTARHLDAWGFPVKVVWSVQPVDLHGDARIQFTILDSAGVDQVTWSEVAEDDLLAGSLEPLIENADWLIDGLLGTGLTRTVEGRLGTAIEALNRSGKPILALDLPSGLDADRGVPLGVAVRARATATFVAPKLGFATPGAADYTGQVAVIDIGIPRRLLRPFEEAGP
jgi:NAD(P)H-hydrate epimerase